MAEKRKAQAKLDAEENRRNEEIRRKSGKDEAAAKEALKLKEAERDALRRKKGKSRARRKLPIRRYLERGFFSRWCADLQDKRHHAQRRKTTSLPASASRNRSRSTSANVPPKLLARKPFAKGATPTCPNRAQHPLRAPPPRLLRQLRRLARRRRTTLQGCRSAYRADRRWCTPCRRRRRWENWPTGSSSRVVSRA